MRSIAAITNHPQRNAEKLYNLYLYEIMGQSNVGAAASANIESDLTGAQTGVQIFSILTNAWETLDCTVNSSCIEDNVVNDRYGVEMRLGKLLKAYYNHDIDFVKYGADGTALAQLGTNDWSNLTVGESYTKSNTKHGLAIAGLTDKRPPRCFIWIQGEADAGTDPMTAAYLANLRSFIDAKRAAYGFYMPFIIVRLSDTQTFLDATRLNSMQASQTTASGDANNYLINTNSITVGADLIHYRGPADGDGIEALAQAVFNVIITIPY